MSLAEDAPAILLLAGIVLFWIGMLGLLWRRSLVGMIVGLLITWVSVAVGGIAFGLMQRSPESEASGGVVVLCIVLCGCLQIAVGLGIIMARIERRGTLDADDAGLLEG
ncbi:MAG: NADH-quinone oxidoreductase subunit NuoK [Myxococcota bacterium]